MNKIIGKYYYDLINADPEFLEFVKKNKKKTNEEIIQKYNVSISKEQDN